jgi:hypothetical protein
LRPPRRIFCAPRGFFLAAFANGSINIDRSRTSRNGRGGVTKWSDASVALWRANALSPVRASVDLSFSHDAHVVADTAAARWPPADSLLTERPKALPATKQPGQFASKPSIRKVSRLGIEPRTLGLKGRIGLSDAVAGIRKVLQ